MRCPRCGSESREGVRFCEDCGARLAALCAACGAELLPGKRFCGSCGAPAGPPAEGRFASPQAYTPRHLAERILTSKAALEGERKQVTVLFADLKGSMELLAERDPEEAREILDPVLERMMEAVHRYEGTVNQVMGDGVMALFGAPLAHEDHAVRACYAALRMQERVKEYAEGVRRRFGVPVHIRVGLNSGEVVVRSIGSDLHMDYTAVGQTTHLAARMEQMAMPGTVLLTAETLRLAEGFVQVRPLGAVPVKGLGEPVEAYEVAGAGPVRTRLQAVAARGLSRFVGRQSELEALRSALERAGSGRGQVVAVVGEAGVGKSRLFFEFTRSHRTRGWLLIEGSSASYGKATPYLPVVDLLKSYFGVEPRDEARRVREKVTGKVLALDRALEPCLPALLSLLEVPADDPGWASLDPAGRRGRTLDALKRLLLRESQAQPLLLVFEDLHWVDSETQAFLDSLIESLPTVRVLLLVNYRPEYRHGWASKTYYTSLRLDPLPPESAQELLGALLGEDAGLEALKGLLIRWTEGNPFFLEESVRTLAETGALEGERGAYRLRKELPSIQVPATVQAVLSARIDRLPPGDKRLLQSASVIGEVVPFPLLQAIAGLSEEELRAGLARLGAAEFLYETSLFPELEYTFKHGLTHQVAYHSLLSERRRALHAAILGAMEALYAGRLAEQVERLAHHALQGEVWEKAIAHLRMAGERAAERSANVQATGHLGEALALLEKLPEGPERADHELRLQIALGPALVATKGGSHPEVESAYRRAHELCGRAGKAPELFPAVWGLWIFYHSRGELRMARELAEELVARASQDPDLLLQALHAGWTTLQQLGDLLPAREHAERGLGLYDRERHARQAFLYGGHDPGVCAWEKASAVHWLLGWPDRASESLRQGLALARELSHAQSLVHCLDHAAWLCVVQGDAGSAQAHVEAVLEAARELGAARHLAAATVLQGWLLAERGEVGEGMARLRQGLAALRAARRANHEPFYLSLLARACEKAGHSEEALALIAEALEAAEATGERYWEAELHRLKGELLRRGGAAEGQAESCFRQALEVARRQEAKSLELRAAVSLGRLWGEQRKVEEARALLSGIYGWFTEGFETNDLKEAKALLEELS